MKTIWEEFRDRAQEGPERVAVVAQKKATTYRELSSMADAIASWLIQNGLVPGDRVALLIPNSTEYVAFYLGILQARMIVVALNPETTASELIKTLGNATPRGVVVGPKAATALVEAKISSIRVVASFATGEFPPEWSVSSLSSILETPPRPLDAPQLDDLGQLIYTSGTTGQPKGVTLSHRNLSANCSSILAYLKLTPEDSVLATLPFFYSYGNSLLFTHLVAGARLVISGDFVFWNRALDVLENERITGFSGVPSTYAMLLHKSDFRKRTFPDLRYLTCAGGGLAPSVVQELRSLVPHVALFLMYGQTEATARLSTLHPEEIERKLGSIGRGIDGVSLRVLDETGQSTPAGEIGEIVAQGENIMVGYWKDTEGTTRVKRPEGLRTGDLARIDEEGYIYIVGRQSDMIKAGAYRINPQEIEETILAIPGIAEVAVIGVPDPIWSEAPRAYVVLSSVAGTETEITASTIVEHCRKTLPRYKLVHDVRFVTSLPRTSSGKIMRGKLKEEALQDPPTSG